MAPRRRSSLGSGIRGVLGRAVSCGVRYERARCRGLSVSVTHDCTPAAAQEFIVQSATGTVRVDGWGVSGDMPLGGDVDGDGKVDFTIYRGGVWYALLSGGGSIAIV